MTWAEKAQKILGVYFARGQSAIEQLKANDVDGANETLNARNAAFHNFRAADHIALKEGYPPMIWQDMCELARTIEVQDKELLDLVKLARDDAERQLQQVLKVRNALGRFRSTESQEFAWIEKSV